MFTVSQSLRLRSAIVGLGVISLSACATKPPSYHGQPSYAVTSVSVDADENEQGLASALRAAVPVGGMGRPASADIEISALHHDSAFLGLFYGGPNYAVLNVRLSDADNHTIRRFSVNVATDAMDDADGALAAKAAGVIAAEAASAFPPMTAKAPAEPTPAPARMEKPVKAPMPAPVAEPVPVADLPLPGDEPCVIGPDGKCIPL